MPRETKVIEKKQPRTMADVEANLWKNNIKKGPRTHTDWLDVSTEDFTKHVSHDVMGQAITPSTFNVFRDSLKNASKEMERRLIENLPDMNLADITSGESSGGDGEDSDSEVVPLDFRTALAQSDNKVMIQARPLKFKSLDEDQPETST